MGADLERLFSRVYTSSSWLTGGIANETRSGAGSFLATTEELRAWLPRALGAFGVRRMADIPCGEWGYMAEVALGDVEYVGCDVVREVVEANAARHPAIRFLHLDATRETPPPVDLIFAKDLFQHLPNPLVLACLSRFTASGARLLVTSCDTFPPPAGNAHRPGEAPCFAPENLQAEPFGLDGKVATVRLDRKYYTVWLLGSGATPLEIQRHRQLLLGTLSEEAPPAARVVEGPARLRLDVLGDEDDRAVVLPASGGFLEPGGSFALDGRALRLLQLADGAAGVEAAAARFVAALAATERSVVDVFPDLVFDAAIMHALLEELRAAGLVRDGPEGLELAEGACLSAPARLGRSDSRFGVDLRAGEAFALSLLLEGAGLDPAMEEASRWHVETVERDARLFYLLAVILGLLELPGPLPRGKAAARLLGSLGKELSLRPRDADPLGLMRLYLEVVREDGWCALSRRVRDHTLANSIVTQIALSTAGTWRLNVDLALQDLLDQASG